MTKNSNLHKAKTAKNDEFYTQLTDIEKELKHYKAHFKNKTIFCNCDDPKQSQFWKYFHLNFNHFGLKKLIATHYHETKPTCKIEYTGEDDNDCEIGVVTSLEANGDFRSPECIELLKEADMVITNPPFSLFREYIAQLIEHDKKFIIMGNNNAITYKEFFPLLKNNQVWLGYTSNKTCVFRVPSEYKHDTKITEDINDGKHYGKVPAISWFTNLYIIKRHEFLDLIEKYTPEKYPKYDNYDAINVNKVLDIPVDYFGVMGVPITFMDKHNSEQFEILGITQRNDDPYKLKKYNKTEYKNANDLNARACIIINNEPKSIYARILIRKKVGV